MSGKLDITTQATLCGSSLLENHLATDDCEFRDSRCLVPNMRRRRNMSKTSQRKRRKHVTVLSKVAHQGSYKGGPRVLREVSAAVSSASAGNAFPHASRSPAALTAQTGASTHRVLVPSRSPDRRGGSRRAWLAPVGARRTSRGGLQLSRWSRPQPVSMGQGLERYRQPSVPGPGSPNTAGMSRWGRTSPRDSCRWCLGSWSA